MSLDSSEFLSGFLPNSNELTISYNCDFCEGLFVSVAARDEHVRLRHAVKTYSLQEPDAPVRLAFPCADCALTFETESELELHRVRHPGFACSYCSVRLATEKGRRCFRVVTQ